MKNLVLCCDWGTTSLRLRLVDRETGKIFDEVRSSHGIAKVFNLWKSRIDTSENDRIEFYLSWITTCINDLAAKTDLNLDDLPIILSGMASSSLGMKELSYADVPFELGGNDTVTEVIEGQKGFDHEILLISGVRTHNDVMRGEEVQLMGMEDLIGSFSNSEDILIVLPGTHSKHVHIEENRIIKFDTFITGELFALMSQNGLLKEAVQASKVSQDSAGWEHFQEGVYYSGKVDILQSLFKVRTNELFRKINKEQNYFFLSGLLIGYELRTLQCQSYSMLVLCCQNGLFDYYKNAIEILGMELPMYMTEPDDVDHFTVSGQLKIYETHVIQ